MEKPIFGRPARPGDGFRELQVEGNKYARFSGGLSH